mgnify:CR=1 FL=1
MMGRVTVLAGLLVCLLIPGCRDRAETDASAAPASVTPPVTEPPLPSQSADICAAYATCCADYAQALVWQQLYEEEGLGATHDSCKAVAVLRDLPGGNEACARAFAEIERAIEPMDRLEGWATPDSCR